MALAITGFLLLTLPVPFRLWAALHVMNTYQVDEYLTNPRARRLWIANMALAFLMPLGIVMLGIASGIWWVLASTIVLAVLVIALLARKLSMRFSGRYRELARAYQWTGPARSR